MLFVFLFACSSDDETLSVNDLSYWVGEYEINVINGQDVDCGVIYLIPETIVINPDGRFQVLSRCDDGGVMVEGDFEFEEGLFDLYVDWVVQEPLDLPEFEMQIFQDNDGGVRVYRCSALTGSCTLRSGQRIN